MGQDGLQVVVALVLLAGVGFGVGLGVVVLFEGGA